MIRSPFEKVEQRVLALLKQGLCLPRPTPMMLTSLVDVVEGKTVLVSQANNKSSYPFDFFF